MKDRWLLCIRCLSPMQHMAGTSRNHGYINRQTYAGDQRLHRVPILSANSLRHNCIREPLGVDLIERYELKEKLDKPELRLLTSGGNQTTESGGRIPLNEEMELRAALPHLSLMGCGLPRGPIDSRLSVSDGVLVCRESLPTLKVIAPELDLPENAWSALRLVADAQHFAPDPSHHLGFALNEEARQQDRDDNIFSGEYVIPGSVFVVEIMGERLTEIELSALTHGLALWQSGGGLLGGKSAHGRGRTECMVWGDLPSPKNYIQSTEQSQGDAEKWLKQLFQNGKGGKTGGTSKSRQKS